MLGNIVGGGARRGSRGRKLWDWLIMQLRRWGCKAWDFESEFLEIYINRIANSGGINFDQLELISILLVVMLLLKLLLLLADPHDD